MFMKKLKRSEEDLGGGSGKGSFESDLFQVTWWKFSRGDQTTIRIKTTNKRIYFDGKVNFLSDCDCLNQLTCTEIISIINTAKKDSFESGKEAKVEEFKNLLEI